MSVMNATIKIIQNRIPAAIHVLENNAPDVATNLDYHALMAVAYQKNGLHEKTVNILKNVFFIYRDP